MTHRDIHAALSALRYQYPTAPTTHSPCYRCRQPARGCGPCRDCICTELAQRWHVPQDAISRLMASHRAVQEASDEMETAQAAVLSSAGGGI